MGSPNDKGQGIIMKSNEIITEQSLKMQTDNVLIRYWRKELHCPVMRFVS